MNEPVAAHLSATADVRDAVDHTTVEVRQNQLAEPRVDADTVAAIAEHDTAYRVAQSNKMAHRDLS